MNMLFRNTWISYSIFKLYFIQTWELCLPFQENNRNLDVDNYKITRDIKNNIKKIFYKVQDSNSLKYLIKSIFIYFVYRNDSKNDKDIVKVFTSRNKIYEPGGKHEIFKQALNCKNLDMYLKTTVTLACSRQIIGELILF